MTAKGITTKGIAQSMNVLIVESPAKAKTINKYLGKDFTVLASFGHIRDLPPKDGSVRPDEDFAMDWATDARSEKHLKEIVQAVKKADKLFLATDPDREGEAISWHVLEELKRRKALNTTTIKRVTFNAITKAAVTDAINNPRDLDQELIDAYLARRALDYLVGFTLSPVLWRKLPGSRSAGRVQSVALRLICQREAEIEAFRTQEYWSVAANLLSPQGKPFTARLTHLDGQKLDKLDLPDATAAERARQAIASAALAVKSIERKNVKRHPAAPFTTSTLQQEAARKLYFSATKTMTLAQRLYEGVTVGGETIGLITYMRTDGVQMAPEAIHDTRVLIGQVWGEKLVPASPRVYKTKQKNAQEAHEAIRPTNVFLKPADVRDALDHDQFRLYELIWKRTVASQMESALLDQMSVDVADPTGAVVLRATGSTVVFDGFLKLYREDLDDAGDGDDENGRILPPLAEGDATAIAAILPEQHFTQPPPRYSEASLVKRMEELGIGRPSTYASIMQVLQDRDYVKLDQRRFVPEDRGRIVTAFLEKFFEKYVGYTFTADLENQLDDISGGQLDYKTVLRNFWKDFMSYVEGTKNLRISEVLDALDADLAPHLFPTREDGHDPRKCPTCGEGRLSLKLGKFGAFIGCSRHPECRYTRPLGTGDGQDGGGDEASERELGTDPASGLLVTMRKGPYGVYVQLGEAEGKKKPKRASLPKGQSPAEMDLEKALSLLSLPREVGIHPETGEMILAGLGRFGPYLKHGDKYVNLREDNVLEIGINRAVDLLAAAKTREKAPAKEIGPHPADQKPITLHDGRYGPYVEHNKVRATLPRGSDKDALTLEQAVALLAAKVAKDGGPAKAKAEPKKAAPKKTTSRKKAAASDAATNDAENDLPPFDLDDAPAAAAPKTARKTVTKKAAAPKSGTAKAAPKTTAKKTAAKKTASE
ncbi:DNA topoisomerase I [Insolitispirillum peregrinum]|uniref:DNA topoisomerase 1 n=2 Tax=Insolitispirillum peregrinum TaxID=80876 RepID=A0A1N7NFM4_9PROT|nr:DNA topoisomerase I [Insolitispirillum peregrinum]